EPCQEVLGEIQAETVDDSAIARIVQCLDGPPLPDGPAFAEMERKARRVLLAWADRRDTIPSMDLGFTIGEGSDTSYWQYRLVERSGGGGMGVVYRAIQVPRKRVVALKMIVAGSCAQAEDVSRLVREGEAIARLRHPNVVQVYELGVHGGLPYF